jgi:RNA polymerase sigma-70 factor (ECF subfamily)
MNQGRGFIGAGKGRDKTTKADPDQQRSRLDQEFPEEVHRAVRGLLTLLSTVRQGRALIPELREGLLERPSSCKTEPPGEEVLNTDHARLIRKAIAKLSAQQQKVIELAYYEGLSQTEMAERMGEPLGTVKTWVRAALKHLREELGQAVVA